MTSFEPKLWFTAESSHEEEQSLLPTRTKQMLQVGFPGPVCRKFIGEYSQHQQ